MTAYANTSDVEAAWRPLTSNEITVVESRLEYISAIIRAIPGSPGIDDRITAGTLDAALVKGVAIAAVIRNLENPQGKSQEQIEDYRYVRDTTTASGQLYLTDAELDLLGLPRRRAFSITPSAEPADCAALEQVALLQRQWLHWPPVGDGTDLRDC